MEDENNNNYTRRLSVVVPLYNAEKYLRECLDSILAQTVKDMEIILVDDGSKDLSGAICDEYAGKHGNIRVFHTENHGQSRARNLGVVHAKGEYIGFVDSDDWIEADMYGRMLRYAEENSLDMVCCGLLYEEKGRTTPKRNGAAAGVYDADEIRRTVLPKALAFGTDYGRDRAIEPHLCDKLIRNSVISRVLQDVDKQVYWAEDVLCIMKCVTCCRRLGIMDCCFYHYRIYVGSCSRSRDQRAISSFSRLLNGLLDMSRDFPEMYDQIRYYSVACEKWMLKVGLDVEMEKFWVFPYEDFKPGTAIALYGAGNVGSCYYGQLRAGEYFRQVDLFDSNPVSPKVKGPKELCGAYYDRIVIAVDKEETALAIRRSLLGQKIPEEKLYWKKPRWVKDTFSFRF